MDVKRKRMLLGLTIDEASRLVGVDACSWSRWEKANGKLPRGSNRLRLELFATGKYDDYARMLLALFPNESGLMEIPQALCKLLLPLCRFLKKATLQRLLNAKKSFGDLQREIRLVYIADVLRDENACFLRGQRPSS